MVATDFSAANGMVIKNRLVGVASSVAVVLPLVVTSLMRKNMRAVAGEVL